MSSDLVFVNGLSIDASIGVYEWEKKIKQRLDFDIELGCSLQTAGISDDVNDTVCYATICEVLASIVHSQHFDLLEALAEQICSTLLTQFPIEYVTLRIHKPGAVPNTKSVGIQIHRLRN